MEKIACKDSDCQNDEDIFIFPLTDLNNDTITTECNEYKDDETPKKQFQISLRVRRRSRALAPLEKLNIQSVLPKSKPITMENSFNQYSNSLSPPFSAKSRWLAALQKLKTIKDPWSKFRIHNCPLEICKRYRYRALKNKWVVDEVEIKMEQDPFNNGALRECFRLKKISTWTKQTNWKYAHNYVAKRYMDPVDRQVYFDDVKLQMDAKLWGEEYNRHNTPKKVDIMQMCILEFIYRPECPIYHLEHFIEGHYIKYNSNSGFVDENLRCTPHAFSHFTFERSGHKLIVVDIQGVGDLWTDPQIHTSDGQGYGDGNLGTKGMALFFHSHKCNIICESLWLSKFDLADSEIELQNKFIQYNKHESTSLKGCLEAVIYPSQTDHMDINSFLNRNCSRSISTGSESIAESSSPNEYMEDSSFTDDLEINSPTNQTELVMKGGYFNTNKEHRRRFDFSESDDSNANSVTDEDERMLFHRNANNLQRSSCILKEIDLQPIKKTLDDSVLGQIHHEMAKYHECGRFVVTDSEPDLNAALFHEQYAAQLGIMEAILTMANLYLDMQRDVLVKLHMDSSSDINKRLGFHYMTEAAEGGDRSAMLFLARAYESGENLAPDKTRSNKIAVNFYQAAIEKTAEDQSGSFDSTMDNPLYILKAKVAELYLNGGYDLNKNFQLAGDLYTEAADLAMAAMKGRLANKYYALAEEACAKIEE